MNFDIGEKELKLRKNIRELFSPDATSPLVELQSDDIRKVRGRLLDWLQRLAGVGYLDPELAGRRNRVELLAVQETLASLAPALFLSVEAGIRIFGRLISLYASPEQQAPILPALQEGNLVGCLGLSENGMSLGNDPLQTFARVKGGRLLVSGYKGHVVNAPLADLIAVAANIAGGPGFCLLKPQTEGLSVGPRLALLGYDALPAASITLEEVPIEKTQVIGPFSDNTLLQEVRTWEDQTLAAAGLGLMRRSFDTARDYAKSHQSGGKPIIAYQEIGFKLAEMLTLLQTSQLLAYRAAWMDAAGDPEARVLAHCAKVFCAESAEAVASHAIAILGGRGFLRGNPAEESYRDAKYLQIAGTSTEISRMKIGDRLLDSI